MTPVITLTLNPAVDKKCSVEQVFAERKLRCGDLHYHPGGGGINVARALRELGGEVVAYWMCGGAAGELLKKLLNHERIEHHPVAMQAMNRENLNVFERSSGQQYRFGMPGAELSKAEVHSAMEALQSIYPVPKYLVLSGSLPPGAEVDCYARIAEGMAPGCRVVLDTSGAALRRGLEGPIYLIKPNMHELEELAGGEIEDDAQVRDVAQSLIRDTGVEVVLTSLGSAGAFLTTGDDHRHVRAPTVKIRSKVGAGDSTVAGVVRALSQGKSIIEAAHYGIAAGSAAVMTEGTDLCRRNDTEQLYEKM